MKRVSSRIAAGRDYFCQKKVKEQISDHSVFYERRRSNQSLYAKSNFMLPLARPTLSNDIEEVRKILKVKSS